MKTFKCGALVEMLVPSDQMDAKRCDKLKRNCESVELLVMQSSQGGSLRVLAHEKEIFVSFSCESLDTFFIEEAWEDILCSAEEISIRNAGEYLIIEIHLSADSKTDRNSDMRLNQDKTEAQTLEKVFSALKKSVDKRLKEDDNPCKINEDRLREISMHSLELLDCVGCTGGRAEIDKNTCDMVEINIWGQDCEIKMVGQGKDAVDFALINICEKGDVIVTQDYGLAALALAKRAYAIHPFGRRYTEDNIDQLLMERHMNQKVRRASGRILF